MCLAVPLKIVEIEGNEATAEREGVSRKVRVDFIKEPKVGDYVMVHAGFAIERLPEEQALEDIAAANEVEQVLREMYEEDMAKRNAAGN